MTPDVSVVIPAYNGALFLPDCLRALRNQRLGRGEFEVIVVDDGSTDSTAAVAESFGVHLLRQERSGAPAARNRGIKAASGRWIGFTDTDCIPSRGWLHHLLSAVEMDSRTPALGAAGRVLGHASDTAPARFVDLTRGLDPERYLAHPKWPFAPTCNVLYRRDALETVGGFDERYCAYDACDLHTRLQVVGGTFHFEPRAVVLHRHRPTWKEYFSQQVNYGRGLGQFTWRHRERVCWSFSRELKGWARVAALVFDACRKGDGADDRLVRRGLATKELAQRLGFLAGYWSPSERRRWSETHARGRQIG